MKECELLNEIGLFSQYYLPQLKCTHPNDTAIILYHLCTDFLESLQNSVLRLRYFLYSMKNASTKELFQVSEEVVIARSQIW